MLFQICPMKVLISLVEIKVKHAHAHISAIVNIYSAMLLLFENCPMNFKTVNNFISCALPGWLLLGSGQYLVGSARFCSVPARFLVGSRTTENSNFTKDHRRQSGISLMFILLRYSHENILPKLFAIILMHILKIIGLTRQG